MDDLLKKLMGIGDNVKNFVVNAIQNVEKAGGNAINQGVHNVQQYFDPNAGAGTNNPNFWRNNPVSQGLANVQQFAAAPPRVDVTQYLAKNPVDQFAGKVINNVVNTPQDILAAGNRIGTDIRNGKFNTPQRVIGDVASAALPIANIATLGEGAALKSAAEVGLKQFLKEGAITGAKYGLGFGTLGGLDANKGASTFHDQVLQTIPYSVGGLVTGTALGALLAGAGAGVNKVTTGMRQAFTKELPAQIASDLRTGITFDAIPAAQSFQKAFALDNLTDKEIIDAVSKFQGGNIGDQIANDTLKRTTDAFLPKELQNLPTPDLANIWDYILARKNGSWVDKVPAELEQLDKAIFQTSGRRLLQAGKIDFNAPIENPLKKTPAIVPGEQLPLPGAPVAEIKAAAPVLSKQEQQLVRDFPQTLQPADVALLRSQGASQEEIDALQARVAAAHAKQNPAAPALETPAAVPSAELQPNGAVVEKPVTQPVAPLEPQINQPSAQLTPQGDVKAPVIPPVEHITPVIDAAKTPVSGLDKIGQESQQAVEGMFTGIKGKFDKLYTEALDRFHPISQLGKMAGDTENTIEKALTGYYGSGSTAKYNIDFQLAPILKGTNLDDLRAFTIAQRDLELAGRGIKGSSANVANSALNDLKTKLGEPAFQALDKSANQLYDYQKGLVQKYLVDTGIMSKDSFKAMTEANQKYVPFQRVMENVDSWLGGTPQTKGAGSVSGQDIIKGIKGSEKQIIDPMQSIVENTYKIIGLGQRQKVAQAIVNLADKLPAGMIKPFEGKAIGNNPVISLFENGQVKKYTVPPEIADAAKGLSEDALSTVVKILAAPTRVFRATATGINPEFALPNVARDLQSAFVNAGLNPLKFVAGLAHYIKQDGVYQDFLKSGGMTARVSLDRPFLQESVDALAGKSGIRLTKPSDIYHLLENLGAYSEQPTRIAAFNDALQKGLKAGLSKDDAMAQAANVAQEATVNFARRGSKTQSVNAIYAFINARAQGVDRLIRTMKSDPIGTSTRIGMISLAPALALYAYNRNFPSYNDPRVLSQTDKNNNFIIMLSDKPIDALGGAQYIKVPKGEIGSLANPVEAFMSHLDGQGGDMASALGSALQAFSPISNAGDVIPTAVRPLAENAANKNFFFGSDIVPKYKEAYPTQDQYTGSTSPVYRAISDGLSKIGVGVSPAKMQNLVEGYGTGYAKIMEMIGQHLVPEQYTKGAKSMAGGADINQTPVVRRFLGGAKRGEAEQIQIDKYAASSTDSQVSQIRSGIKRGEIDPVTGMNQIKQLQNNIAKGDKQASSVGGAATGAAADYAQAYDFAKYLQPNTETGIAQYKFEDDKAAIARKIYDGDSTYAGIPDSAKNDIFAAMGYQPEDVQYDSLANEAGKVKSKYLLGSLSKAKSHEEVITTLLAGRKESISGSQFVSDSMLTDAKDAGLINAAEAKYLKSITINSDGTQKQSSGSGGAGAAKGKAALNSFFSAEKSIGAAISKPPQLQSLISASKGATVTAAPAAAKLPSSTVDVNVARKAGVTPISVSDVIANSKLKNSLAPKVTVSGKVAVGGRGGTSNTAKLSQAFYHPKKA